MTCCISISARSIREPNASKTIESAIGTSTIYDPKEDGRQGRKLEGKGRREDMNTFFFFFSSPLEDDEALCKRLTVALERRA